MAIDSSPHTTRGHGLLEPFLAHLRAKRANKLIPRHLREGRILDVGCGSYPYFLSHTYFAEKFAVDQLEKPQSISNINWYSLDLNAAPKLPFESKYFDLVTMLAVVEHLSPNSLVTIFQEVHRVLRPGGRLVIGHVIYHIRVTNKIDFSPYSLYFVIRKQILYNSSG